jgi:hypothetical protein
MRRRNGEVGAETEGDAVSLRSCTRARTRTGRRGDRRPRRTC